MRLTPGTRLGPYEIRALLGVGGMGEVYRAHDSRLGRDVAVKVLPESVSSDRERLKRFEQEARAAAALNHPNIVAVYDVGSHEGSPYIVSELLSGETLRERLRAGPMSVPKVFEVATPLARALSAAHEKGIVHRDLKPENVFLTRDGQVKVLDFGLAKLRPSPEELASGSPTATRPTADGVVLGTTAYMSPEQVRGQATGAASDLFSFGVVLYEMLAGRRPFIGESTADVMAAILNQTPPPLNVAPLLEQIAVRCLEKRAQERFHSAHDLALALEALSHTESTPQASVRSSLTTRRWILVAIVLLGICVGWLVWRSSKDHAPIRSVAVLPLENLSGDPEEGYFVDGMTDELIAQLAQVSALKVISRTSVMQYKTERKPIPEVAHELGVDAVVEGSVRRSGNRVRITAQLIEGATDRHLWAQSLDRDMGDVLTLQGEVARALVEEIRIAVTPEEETRLGRTRSVDPEAYQLYLKGNYLMLQTSEGTYERARDAYQQAIDRDPRFAPAYAGLAMAYMEIGGWLGSLDPREVKAQAKQAIDMALSIDDSTADALIALGTYEYYFGWDWPRAERAFQRGLELIPSSSYARLMYANFLTSIGRVDESIALGRLTLALDPLFPAVYNELAWALQSTRRYEEAEALYKRGLELDPSFPHTYILLSGLYVSRGQLQEAISAAENATRLAPALKVGQANLGYIYGLTGRRDEARKILEDLERRLQSEHVSPVDLGTIYGALGEDEKAMDLLEQGFENGDFRMVLLKPGFVYDPLRSNSRFQDLLRRMNLPR